MAELALLATAVGSGTAAAGGIGATLSTIASVGLTAASAFSSISAGNEQAASLNLQARQSTLNARAERLEGKRQSLAISEQLSRDLASQNALFGARGVLQGEGSSLAASQKAKENASADIKAAQFNADIAALSAEQRAANARSEASTAKSSGVIGAVKALGNFSPIPSAPTGGGSVPIPSRKPTLLSGL